MDYTHVFEVLKLRYAGRDAVFSYALQNDAPVLLCRNSCKMCQAQPCGHANTESQQHLHRLARSRGHQLLEIHGNIAAFGLKS